MKLNEAVALFEVANKCNLNCKHCYRKDMGGFQLKLNQIKIITDKLSEGGITSVILSGGEPLLREDLFEIIDYSQDCGIEEVVINTNGTRLKSSRIISEIEKHLDIISSIPVSFDGAREESHDYIRGKGQFSNLLSSLKEKMLDELPIGLNVTLGKWNFNDFERFFELYDELDAFDINFGIFIPFGVGKQIADQVLSSTQISQLIKMTKEKYDAGYEVELCSVPYSKIVDKEISGLCCNLFSDMITITAQGNVIPCLLYDFVCGSLLERNLDEILSHKLVDVFRKPKKLKKKMIGHCQVCKNFNLCRGGCNLLSYAMCGNIYESDPLCPFRKG